MKNLAVNRGDAFSLIEVTLALGVAGFCLIAMFGLLPVSLRSNQAAMEQTAANSIVTSISTDMRATSPTVPVGTATVTKQYAIGIPADGSQATQTIFFNGERKASATKQTDSRYAAKVTFLINSSPRGAALSVVKVWWPASAIEANAQGSVQTFVALDRN